MSFDGSLGARWAVWRCCIRHIDRTSHLGNMMLLSIIMDCLQVLPFVIARMCELEKTIHAINRNVWAVSCMITNPFNRYVIHRCVSYEFVKQNCKEAKMVLSRFKIHAYDTGVSVQASIILRCRR